MRNLVVSDHSNKAECQFVIDVGSHTESLEEVLRTLCKLLAVGKPMLNKEIVQREDQNGAYRELKDVAEITSEAKSEIFNAAGIQLDNCEKEELVQRFIKELKSSSDDASKEITETLKQFFDDVKHPFSFSDAPESYVIWLEKCAIQSIAKAQDDIQRLTKMFDLHCKIEHSHTSTKREVYNIVQYGLVYSTEEVEKIIESFNSLNSILERPRAL